MRYLLLTVLLLTAACGGSPNEAGVPWEEPEVGVGLTDQQVQAFVTIYPRYIQIPEDANQNSPETSGRGAVLVGEMDKALNEFDLTYQHWSQIYMRVTRAKSNIDEAVDSTRLSANDRADVEALLNHWDAILAAFGD